MRRNQGTISSRTNGQCPDQEDRKRDEKRNQSVRLWKAQEQVVGRLSRLPRGVHEREHPQGQARGRHGQMSSVWITTRSQHGPGGLVAVRSVRNPSVGSPQSGLQLPDVHGADVIRRKLGLEPKGRKAPRNKEV